VSDEAGMTDEPMVPGEAARVTTPVAAATRPRRAGRKGRQHDRQHRECHSDLVHGDTSLSPLTS